MSLLISDSHPALTLSAPFKEHCDVFLKKHNLNYFQYIRVNKDGSSSLLTNKVDFTSFALQHAIKANVPLIYSCVKKEILNPNSYYFLWEPNLPVAPVAMARNEFNICNGLTFVERYPTHYTMIAFGAPHNNLGILDFYLNNIDILSNFIQEFKIKQSDVLQKLEGQPLILPPPQMDENLQEMLLKQSANIKNTKKQYPVTFANRVSYITQKEYECIRQLPYGLSAKQIGRALNISQRTVEQYFERVRTRVGCSTKAQLIQLLFS